MKTQLTTTNIKNVDFENMCLINSDDIKVKIYDATLDVFLFEDIKSGKQRRSNLMSASIFNDLIIEDKIKFIILGMLSKNNFNN